MTSTIGFALALGTICFFIGWLLGDIGATRATEKRWSNAVRKAAYPRYPMKWHLPPGVALEHDWDQPNGKCSSCGAPLNSQCIGGYRLHELKEWVR